MGKIYIADLANVLVRKHRISKSTANLFLTSIIDCIQDGIADDGQVKIKGLGTFKLVDMEARESVSVNTGERVVIGSHQKLTFVPDNALKELVNKPFSQFKTVILNDGVDPADLNKMTTSEEALLESVEEVPEETEQEIATEQETETVSEQEAETASEQQKTVNKEEEEADEKEAKAEEQTEEEPLTEDEEPTEPVSGVEDYFKDEMPKEEKAPTYWWAWLLLAMAACVVSFAGGYIFGTSKSEIEDIWAEPLDSTEVAALLAEKDSTAKDSTTKALTVKDVEAKDSTAKTPAVKEEAPKEEAKKDDVKKDDEKKETAKNEPKPDWQKYEDMDSRVRYGAYRIVGTDQEVTLKAGQTVQSISRSILGPGMECYVEVYNGVKASDQLKEGQKIKIPKLELKKKNK